MEGAISRLYHRHLRLTLILSLLIAIVVLAGLHKPDLSLPSFQWPGLLPSRYPPSRRPSIPLLDIQLSNASSLLSHICPGLSRPIHSSPGLTIAQERRYDHLRSTSGRYMLVTTIREIQAQLPDLLNALLVLLTYLGPHRLSLSVLEGPSGDCTSEAFESVVGPLLSALGIPSSRLHIVTKESNIDFGKQNRIEALAELRNRALSPLWEGHEGHTQAEGGSSGDGNEAGRSGESDQVDAVVMFNDVFVRASDILELLHQHIKTGAGITAAWDWMERRPGYFYDVWVGRTVSPPPLVGCSLKICHPITSDRFR